MKLPGLIDVHVHMREPGATHKEDWDSGTAAALAGGVTMVLAMPNTRPPVTDAASLALARDAARKKARCDYGHFLGATADNAGLLPAALARRSVGLKLYVDATYGPLRLDDMDLWLAQLEGWPADRPVATHAEGRSLGAMIALAAISGRSIHFCHVSRREEILLIRAARDKGLPVTCEVTPHHLFLCEEDVPRLGKGRSRVCPRLASARDRAALWEHLEVVDAFATDHAPHLPEEKDGPDAPPGFPGLETLLPLLLTAVHEGKLSEDDLVARLSTGPRRIFGLPEQPRTWVEVDPDAEWTIAEKPARTKAGWTPFAGRRVRGRVERVVLRGATAYEGGVVLSPPGAGRDAADERAYDQDRGAWIEESSGKYPRAGGESPSRWGEPPGEEGRP